MTWVINPTITVAGVEYTNLTFNQVSIDYGRSKIFDTPRPGYARLDIVNLTDTVYPFKINDSLVIELENTASTDVTVFTGIITDVKGSFRSSDTADGVGVITLTAVAPMAQMSRVVVGSTVYPSETDAARINRILTEAGVTIDVVDSAIYTFSERPIRLTDAYTLANNYAMSVLGSIYETTDGKVGYANESRRRQEAITNGFTSIPNSSIVISSINSNENIADVMNLTNITYTGGTVSDFDATSQSTYGVIGASFNTELADASDAQTIAGTYINMRAVPRKSLSSFSIRLLDPTLTNSLVNTLLDVYFGMPIEVPGLPNSIVDVDYEGYVEGWNITFSPANAVLTLKTSQEAYSYRDTRWQDVDPTTQWDDLDPTATRSTKTNLLWNPSFEPIDYGQIGYVDLPGQAGYFLQAPDEAALDITGDIDIRVKVALDDWTPGTYQSLIHKNDTNNYSYGIGILHTAPAGRIGIDWTTNGTTQLIMISSVVTGITDGTVKWVRATLDVDNGASGRTAKFYTSDDGTSWTQLGTDVTTAGTTSIFSGSGILRIGQFSSTTLPSNGKIYAGSIRNGIDGTEVFAFDIAGNWKSTDIDSFTATTGQTISLSSPMTRYNYSSATGTTSRVTNDKYSGISSLKFEAASGATSIVLLNTTNNKFQKRIPCASGDTFYFQARMKQGSGSRTGQLRLLAYINETSTSIVEQFISTTTVLDSTWKLIQVSGTLTNANSLYLTPYIAMANSGSIGDFIYLDSLIIEKDSGGYAAYYFDGSYSEIPDVRAPNLAWSGSSNNSTSTANTYWGTQPTTLWNNVDEQGIP